MSSRGDHHSPSAALALAAAGRGLLSRSFSRLSSSHSSRSSARLPSLDSQRSSITTLGSFSTSQSEGAAADLRDLINLGRVCSESAPQVERSAEGAVLCRRAASFSTSHFVSVCDTTPPSSRRSSERLESSSDGPSTRGSSLNSMDTDDSSYRRQSLCLTDGCVGVVTASGELRRVRGLPANFSPWELQPEDIQFCKSPKGGPVTLGKGAFGEVLLATLKGLIPVAVKKLPTDHNSSAIKEAAMLKALQNANIVQFQGACIADDTLLLVTEFMEGGDLCKAISKRSVTWHRKGTQIALDIVRGLHYLHSNRVVHLDLKSPNILLSRHGAAKLADIGLARIKQDAHTDASAAAGALARQVSIAEPVIGTFSWAAPELLASRSWTEKADIFSLGVVLWEIVTGEQPKRGCMRPVRVPEECPEEIAQLIEDCMEPEPEQRPSAIEVYTVVRHAQKKAATEAKARSLARRSTPLSRDLPPIPSNQQLPTKLAQLLTNRPPSEAAQEGGKRQSCGHAAAKSSRAMSAPPLAMEQLLQSAVGF